jgi:hypothetical protein
MTRKRLTQMNLNLRRLASWVTAAALISLTLLPVATEAATASFTSRKTVLSTSEAGATANYDINVTAATATTLIKAFRLQVCDSPLQSIACSAPSGFVWGSTIATQTLGGSAFANTYAGSPSGTDFLVTNALGNNVNTGQVVRFVINGNTNSTTANQEFYLRVTSCSDTTCNVGSPYTNNIDFGGMAVSTSQKLSVTANVQEDLTFCVGTSISSDCSTVSGATVTLAPNPMTTSGASKGTAVMAASTNAGGGYIVTYNGTSFTDTTADTITAASSSGVALGAGGTEQFGFNLAANSGGNFGTFGAAPSGGSGAATSPYGTNNQIAYSTAGAVQVASAAGPSSQTTYTMSFGANVAGTTKAGAYTATQTFIATGTF